MNAFCCFLVFFMYIFVLHSQQIFSAIIYHPINITLFPLCRVRRENNTTGSLGVENVDMQKQLKFRLNFSSIKRVYECEKRGSTLIGNPLFRTWTGTKHQLMRQFKWKKTKSNVKYICLVTNYGTIELYVREH